MNKYSSNTSPSANVLFGGGIGPAEEGELGEYFFNQINYCWETSHFSPFNFYSMGNPSNTPSLRVKRHPRDAAAKQGGRQKVGWSVGKEQTTGGEEKPKRRERTSSDKGGKEKTFVLISLLANWSRLECAQ